jgi:hypothetical protein
MQCDKHWLVDCLVFLLFVKEMKNLNFLKFCVVIFFTIFSISNNYVVIYVAVTSMDQLTTHALQYHLHQLLIACINCNKEPNM